MNNYTPLDLKKLEKLARKSSNILLFGDLFLFIISLFLGYLIYNKSLISTQQKASSIKLSPTVTIFTITPSATPIPTALPTITPDSPATPTITNFLNDKNNSSTSINLTPEQTTSTPALSEEMDINISPTVIENNN